MTEKEKNQTDSTTSSRRTFFTTLWILLGIAAIAEFIGVVSAFLMPRKRNKKAESFGTVIEAGSVDKFPLESVTAFIRGKFYLARLEDGGFLVSKMYPSRMHGSMDVQGEEICVPMPLVVI